MDHELLLGTDELYPRTRLRRHEPWPNHQPPLPRRRPRTRPLHQPRPPTPTQRPRRPRPPRTRHREPPTPQAAWKRGAHLIEAHRLDENITDPDHAFGTTLSQLPAQTPIEIRADLTNVQRALGPNRPHQTSTTSSVSEQEKIYLPIRPIGRSPDRRSVIFQAGHAGSIPVTRSRRVPRQRDSSRSLLGTPRRSHAPTVPQRAPTEPTPAD